ncbi:MAG: hypothetical protein E3J29_07360, partial [Dehalococcoidia bacterium]
MVRSSLFALAGLAFVAWLAAACSDDAAQPAPTATMRPPLSLATRTPAPTWTPSATPRASATPTPSATRTPSPTPTSAATATPEVIDGVEVIPLQIGEEVELPDDVALIVKASCQPCDGPSSGLYLVYRDASGQVRMEELSPGKTPGLLPPGSGPVHNVVVNSDASEMVVDVCTRGECVWIDDAGPEAESTLYRSTDGGASWEESGVLDGKHYPVAITEKGLVVRAWGPETKWEYEYELFPSGGPL